ncbi:MAG: DUF2461 domain-containing protein [Bacteroidota bacterium]
MSKQKIYQFLENLSNNNSKEWMEANRSTYQAAKEIWLTEVQVLLDRLSKHDPYFTKVSPKKCIFRINNNRRFQPDRPLYKDNFGFAPVQDMFQPSLYVHISPQETFIGGGLHRPPSDNLKKMRQAIDYDGQRLKEIVTEKKFATYYGGLSHDPQALKTSPRGYDESHEHIDLLRRKNFTAIRPVTQEEFVADSFVDLVEEGYLLLQPMNSYLADAINFEN